MGILHRFEVEEVDIPLNGGYLRVVHEGILVNAYHVAVFVGNADGVEK